MWASGFIVPYHVRWFLLPAQVVSPHEFIIDGCAQGPMKILRFCLLVTLSLGFLHYKFLLLWSPWTLSSIRSTQGVCQVVPQFPSCATARGQSYDTKLEQPEGSPHVLLVSGMFALCCVTTCVLKTTALSFLFFSFFLLPSLPFFLSLISGRRVNQSHSPLGWKQKSPYSFLFSIFK